MYCIIHIFLLGLIFRLSFLSPPSNFKWPLPKMIEFYFVLTLLSLIIEIAQILPKCTFSTEREKSICRSVALWQWINEINFRIGWKERKKAFQLHFSVFHYHKYKTYWFCAKLGHFKALLWLWWCCYINSAKQTNKYKLL